MDQRQLTELESGESLLGALRFVLLSTQVISELVSACRGFIFQHSSNSVMSQAESSFPPSLSTDQIKWYQFSFSVTKHLSIIPVQKLEMNLPVLCWELRRATEPTTASLHAAWRAASAPKRLQAAGSSAGFLPSCNRPPGSRLNTPPSPRRHSVLHFCSGCPQLARGLVTVRSDLHWFLRSRQAGSPNPLQESLWSCSDFPSF